MRFRCPRCSGFCFGTRLDPEKDFEIIGYECHSMADGQPDFPFYHEKYKPGRKPCGWRGKPEEVDWVDEIPEGWDK